MPYNNTPIAPPKEFSGHLALPLARVKKIIHADDAVMNCSNNAAYCIAVATEMFIQHLVEQAHNVVKSEKRPRRNIQYRDVASAVARVDNLEFLGDVVPQSLTYKQFTEKRAKMVGLPRETLPVGQRTLDDISGLEAEDSEMMDISNGADVMKRGENGSNVNEDGGPKSPSNSKSGLRFDAVRDDYTPADESTVHSGYRE